MYKIKRFSLLLDKLFSLSKAKEEFENKNNVENLVVHFVLFMCTRCSTDLHWSYTEIPTFIYELTKEFNRHLNKLSYLKLIDVYKNNKHSIDNSAINIFKKESKSKNSKVNVDKCRSFLNENLEVSFKDFLTKLDDIKKRERRVIEMTEDDRNLISGILFELRDKYMPE